MAKERLVKVLNWGREDIEQRLGFKGARFTDTNPFLAFGIGMALWLLIFGPLFLLPPPLSENPYVKMFLARGPTPFVTVLFFCWALAIMLLKLAKLNYQHRPLELMIVPQSHDFTLAPSTAKDILDRMYGLVDDPGHYILLNRIERALSNLSNIGVISDVSEILRAQAENDEAQMESSYALIRGFVWSIPILGFIGTVLGLSQAIGNFGGMLSGSGSIDDIKVGLQSVTGGLSTAFDTTLLALVAALLTHLFMTALKKKEEMFLDECKEYCQAYIVSRLRLIHLQASDPVPVSSPLETTVLGSNASQE